MANEINELIERSKIKVAHNEWHQYLTEELTPLRDGSKDIPLKWGSLILLSSIIVSIIVILLIILNILI